jgi:uncharacterized surface protein with fasciclin (FAS1) repeats
MYYKFRTKSSDPITEETDFTVPTGETPPVLKVYHKERFLPILSDYTFTTKGINAASNYEYFYPSTKWTGQGGGFNISNASVTEYALVADNGYVYVIDKVLEPLETVYTELEKESNFSLFFQIYNRFTDYHLDETATQNYGNGENLYLHYHTGLPKIASEWTYNGEWGLPDYSNFPVLSRVAYNVFAPNNESLQNFFNSFWSEYYTSIDKVNFLPIKYLLDNHVYEGDFVFPEEINKGKIKTTYGTAVDFDTQNTRLKKICSNGSLYGLNQLMVPEMFGSVTAPLFKNPKYAAILQMMHDVQLIQPLMSRNVSFTFFIPTDNLLLNNTIIDGDRSLYCLPGNVNKFGDEGEGMFTDSDDGLSLVPLSRSWERQIASNHISSTLVSSVGDLKVYKTLNSFQYLLVDNNEQVYSSDSYNNYQDENKQPARMKKVYEAYNGVCYEIDGDNSTSLLPDLNQFKDQITKNTLPEFTSFRDLVQLAGFNTATPPFDFLMGRFIVLIPTNDVITAGQLAGKIPPTKEEAAEYLKYYFININASGLSDYLFPGYGKYEDVTTYRLSGRTYGKLTVIDAGDRIQIKDAKGNVVNVVKIFPYIYNDGAAYLIDGLLEF